jgi:site-specific DNA-methyltransferase (adenine-specific)
MPESPPVGQIVQGDVLEVLPTWPEGCVDLVFADPPFNIRYQYDKYRDDLPPHEYLEWTAKWIDACLRVLVATGTFWIAIGDEYAAEIRAMMRRRAALRNWVIWHYTFGQSCRGKFNRGHAHLFYFVKDPRHFTFNADAVRVPSDRQLKYADARANPKGKLPDDVWTYSRVCGTFKERVGWHPCQMPVSLLERIVAACSNPGDLVLDPFAGSGATLVAAARLGRRWIGVELSEQYAAKAAERARNARSEPVSVERDGVPPGPPHVIRKRAAEARAAGQTGQADSGAPARIRRKRGRPRKRAAGQRPSLFAWPQDDDAQDTVTGTE